jgi:simple sugar transport system substrate-binding protein/ribose transport system substrate-binding protein
MFRKLIGALALALIALPASAFELGVVAFQMSAETHARTANAVKAAGEAKGWSATVLNSDGNLQKHTQQLDDLIQRGVDAIVVCMGKPVQADAQFEGAKAAGIPVITIMSGTSPHTLFDVQVNEYKVGAEAALYLLGQINYQGPIMTQRFEGNVGTRIRGKILDAVLSENTAVEVIGSHTMARTKTWRDDVRNGMSALILQNKDRFEAIWASFDGQAFIIDDLLREQGYKKGDITLVSIDGGPEAYRRIADAESMLMATVAIPFEAMGAAAVDAMDKIAVQKQPKTSITAGPYLYQDAVLVDAHNVKDFM